MRFVAGAAHAPPRLRYPCSTRSRTLQGCCGPDWAPTTGLFAAFPHAGPVVNLRLRPTASPSGDAAACTIRGTRKPGPMDVYLPIAELTLNVFAVLGLGAVVGIVTGVFGLGGGFLLTPMLIFVGVPAGVAVASSANQLVGASLSGVIGYWRRGAVDFKMGTIMMLGGLAGSALGVLLFTLLNRLRAGAA